ncbi:MAG: histidine kinase [Proteobacteria bacterium]|nr:histidine kinase [Pseudomonadota bacterium]
MDHTTTTRLRYWPWIVAIWSGIGLIDATQTVFPMRAQDMHHDWFSLFLTLMLNWLPWALATPFVIELGRRFSPTRPRKIAGLIIHLAAAAAICLVSAAWSAGLETLLNPWIDPQQPPFSELWLPKIAYGALTTLVLYAFILTIDFALESRRRAAHQQTEAARFGEKLSKARLESLRRQIEPHFMFNALNAIAGLVRQQRNEPAVDMIVALSDFLRSAAEDSNSPQVPLAREVEHLRQYLEIQKARFAERLHVTVDIPPHLLSAPVPSLILQPLVENAIKHGISKLAQGGSIQVTAARANDMLNLSVGNDGPNLPPDFETTGSGIGIANLRTRLQILYGTGFRLSLRNQQAGGVQVSISLPFAGTQ